MEGSIQLVLGGARSGKSAFAQKQVAQLQQQTGLSVIYVATATPLDDEMQRRIVRHQQDRPKDWQLAEVPLELADFISQQNTQSPAILLIDCLTLWLNNQLYHYPEQEFDILFEQLATSLRNSKSPVFMVSNEVGLGVIPMGEVTRQFVDQAGWLNQKIASVANEVTFVAAGLPLSLKSNLP